MNSLVKTCVIAAYVIPYTANAENWFIKPYMGLSSMSDIVADANNINGTVSGNAAINLEAGFNAGLSGGYYYNDNLAVEFGWEYRSNESQTNITEALSYPEGNYASSTFYLNGLYHFSSLSNWQPYIGAGLVWVQEIDIDLERDGSELSYSGSGDVGLQAIVGTNYRFNKHWALQFEARYTSISGVDLAAEEGAMGRMNGLDYEPTSLQLGLIYKF